MKKVALLGMAIFALGITACNNSKSQNNVSVVPGGPGDRDVLYSGILPAADAQGTLCTIKLEYDDDHNYTDGDFTMVENSIVGDTIAVAGIKEAATSYSEGDFRKASKQVNGGLVEYLVLTPKAKEILGAASASPSYFIVNADQSLTLVNSDLELPIHPELYTLTVK